MEVFLLMHERLGCLLANIEYIGSIKGLQPYSCIRIGDLTTVNISSEGRWYFYVIEKDDVMHNSVKAIIWTMWMGRNKIMFEDFDSDGHRNHQFFLIYFGL